MGAKGSQGLVGVSWGCMSSHSMLMCVWFAELGSMSSHLLLLSPFLDGHERRITTACTDIDGPAQLVGRMAISSGVTRHALASKGARVGWWQPM